MFIYDVDFLVNYTFIQNVFAWRADLLGRRKPAKDHRSFGLFQLMQSLHRNTKNTDTNQEKTAKCVFSSLVYRSLWLDNHRQYEQWIFANLDCIFSLKKNKLNIFDILKQFYLVIVGNWVDPIFSLINFIYGTSSYSTQFAYTQHKNSWLSTIGFWFCHSCAVTLVIPIAEQFIKVVTFRIKWDLPYLQHYICSQENFPEATHALCFCLLW